MTEPTLRELGGLARDLGAVLAPADPAIALRHVVAAGRTIFGSAACSVALVTADEEALLFVAADGAGSEEVVGVQIPVGRGIAGWVAMSGQAILVSEVRRDPRFAADVAESTGYVPESILAAPLVDDERVVGVLEVLDRDASRAGAGQDMQTVTALATVAATAVRSARALNDVGRLLLTAAADATDDGDLAAALRRAATDLPDADPDLRELAALLADLGRRGPAERRLAVRVLDEFVRYLGRRERRRS